MADEPKTKLTDVIAALAGAIAQGRRASDFEVGRVARVYQRIPYLQGMSIPRMRIQQVVIELPIVCREMIPGTPCKLAHPVYITNVVLEKTRIHKNLVAPLQGRLDSERSLDLVDVGGLTQEQHLVLRNMVQSLNEDILKDLAQKLYDQYVSLLWRLVGNKSTTDLPDEMIKTRIGDVTEQFVRAQLIDMLVKIVDTKNSPAPGPGNPPAEPTTEAAKMVQAILGSPIIADLVKEIREAAESAAIEIPAQAPDIVVETNTEEVKNSANAGAVTRLRLVLGEEGLEWSSETAGSGTKSWRLGPE
jgi:hypothetical protein